LMLRRHGLDTLLYLVSAHTKALADGIAIGREQHRRSRQEYVADALKAARVMAESL